MSSKAFKVIAIAALASAYVLTSVGQTHAQDGSAELVEASPQERKNEARVHGSTGSPRDDKASAMHKGKPGKHHGPVKELAEYLGMDVKDLIKEWKEKGTLAKVIEAHGKTVAQAKTVLEQKMNERLAKAVADGKLTQEEADKMKSKHSEMLDKFLNSEAPKDVMGKIQGEGKGPRNGMESRQKGR